MTDSAVNADERRRFFRIDDQLSFSYTVVPLHELPGRVTRLRHGMVDTLSVSSDLSSISRSIRPAMLSLEHKQPEVAEVLRALDAKIELLGRALLMRDEELARMPAREVNISASGLAFRAEEELPVGSMLELKMILFPGYTGILTYGEVVRCLHQPQEDADYPWNAAVDFAFIRDEDRELLISHVVGRQSSQIRGESDT